MTFAQAKQLGAHVRKGDRSVRVVHAGTFTPKEEREGCTGRGDATRWRDATLKAHRVFHVSQIEGAARRGGAPAPAPTRADLRGRGRARAADHRAQRRTVRDGKPASLLSAVGGPGVGPPGGGVSTSRSTGTARRFTSWTHMTGHPSRLDRDLGGFGGSRADYAREELLCGDGRSLHLRGARHPSDRAARGLLGELARGPEGG